MAKSDRPLSVEERAGIATGLQLAMTWIGVGRVPPTPAQLHEMVNQAINGFREQNEKDRADNLDEATQCLGALWGQALCDQFGWTWVMMQVDKQDDAAGIVTSNRSHLIYPIRYINRLLASPTQEQTLDKVFKTIQSNKLPKSLPRGYMVVSGGKSTLLF